MSLYDLIENIIGWTYSTSANQQFNSTIMYCACAMLLLFFSLTVDLLYKLLLRFLPNNLK